MALTVQFAAVSGAGADGSSVRLPAKPSVPTAASEAVTTARRARLPSLTASATPEQRVRLAEERKRIAAGAAAAGTDPTAIVGFHQLNYGHNAFTNGLRTDAATAVVRLPLIPNWQFQITLPYVWADLDRTKGFSVGGTSDLVLRTGGRLYASENVALFAGLDASFPAASEKRLGTGQHTLGPGIAVAAPLPRLHSLSYVLLSNFNSVGEDPRRASLRYLQIQAAVNTLWTPSWWTLLTWTWDTDWNNRRRATLNLPGQVG